MSDPANKVPCPVCGKPAEPRLQPFCSRRCADVDLGRWLTGQYSVPSAVEGEDPGDHSDHGP
jgi:endogenous inhibitor of DNA gyrase (YacG/DUF329 family)